MVLGLVLLLQTHQDLVLLLTLAQMPGLALAQTLVQEEAPFLEATLLPFLLEATILVASAFVATVANSRTDHNSVAKNQGQQVTSQTWVPQLDLDLELEMDQTGQGQALVMPLDLDLVRVLDPDLDLDLAMALERVPEQRTRTVVVARMDCSQGTDYIQVDIWPWSHMPNCPTSSAQSSALIGAATHKRLAWRTRLLQGDREWLRLRPLGYKLLLLLGGMELLPRLLLDTLLLLPGRQLLLLGRRRLLPGRRRRLLLGRQLLPGRHRLQLGRLLLQGTRHLLQLDTQRLLLLLLRGNVAAAPVLRPEEL